MSEDALRIVRAGMARDAIVQILEGLTPRHRLDVLWSVLFTYDLTDAAEAIRKLAAYEDAVKGATS